MRDLSNRSKQEIPTFEPDLHFSRIIRLTRELETIQRQLQWSSFQNLTQAEQNQVLSTVLNTGLVESLKDAADRLSNFLWCYVEAAAQNSCTENPDDDVDYDLQSRNLEHATETLRLLHFSSSLAKDPVGFMERITVSVNRHMETGRRQKRHHLERSA